MQNRILVLLSSLAWRAAFQQPGIASERAIAQDMVGMVLRLQSYCIIWYLVDVL
jgi:hypothetical protein